jgi:catechol 2,3-dioxygenase-like lactoylglutathione lyase family enzyme
MVMLNVDDMDKACAFYANTMGLKLKFRDGERWAAFDAGSVTLALAGGSERANTPVALNFKVANVDEALARVTADGARREGQTATSAHEVRAAVRDLDGHVINLYSPLPKK